MSTIDRRIKAIKWTGENKDEVRKNVPASVIFMNHMCRIEDGGRELGAVPGDYILIANNVHVLDQSMYEDLFSATA